MLELLYSPFLINIAHAGYNSSTEETTTFLVAQFGTAFWSPFGIWAVFALGIGIAMMIWRRIRGTARRPK